jgi:NADPH:quinone reductase-like Zn-dependent oxidoreductase
MHAIAIERFGGREELRPAELPEPLVGPDAILIRLAAAGVNPVDIGVREGRLQQAFPTFFPLIPGWDAAGVVEAVGPSVTEVEIGDEVFAYARKDFVRDGTYAELVGVTPRHVAKKPRSLSLVEAGAVPLAGLTAYQVIFDALALEEGETVLVHGAAGGVGHFAVQLAVAAGARVIGTARARNHDFLRELGAERCIDYEHEDFAAVLGRGQVDAVVDVVGGETQERSVEVIREGGRLASIVMPPDRDRFAAHDIAARYVFVRPDADELAALGAMFDAGQVRVHLHAQIPLDDAAQAHELVEAGHPHGKVVLTIP